MIHDLILVGTGFASTFFLREYLAHAPGRARVLVLERGWREPRAWQLEHRTTSRIASDSTFTRAGRVEKEWRFTLAFGGGSNCWWACAPRLMPNDFALQSTYGVGVDWPVTYADLEPFYEEIEDVMAVSGASGATPYPRRSPHPQPPHRLSDPDEVLAAAYPGTYVVQPTARARVATRNRPMCCATGVCGLCPVDAKFTIENELSSVFDDPRVTLELGAEVRRLEFAAGRATGAVVAAEGRERLVQGDLVVLGAGAIFNPAILLRSDLPHPLLGLRLFEQMSITADVDLAGVDNFQGSTVVTGHGYMRYDGPHRARQAACLIESWNRPDELRWDPGRERQILRLKLILEDLPQDRNRIRLGEGGMPVLEFHDYSEYAYRGLDGIAADLETLLAPLPVERIAINRRPLPTEGHILGTVVMGRDPATSVVDPDLVHHQIRNLVVLGGSAFPTGSPANPTLTISALALWSARHLFGGRPS